MSGVSNEDEIRRIFDEATDLPADKRDAFVDEASGGDKRIAAEVRSLLKHFDTRGSSAEDDSSGSFRTLLEFGGFEIVEEIGAGGMGIVYLAHQESPRRDVALKVMHPGAMHPDSHARFRQETQLLARLQHPAIASVYESHLDEPSVPPYFVMEYVQGNTLEKHIEQHELPIAEVVELIARVTDGAHAAHQRGVIHRDLKPANILVNREGQPKILDFGIARLVEPGDVTVAPRTVGGFLGTIPYMSPEQLGGSTEDLDIRVDVYSLGVVAFQCLEGRLPFDVPAGNPLAAAQQILDTPTPRLSSQASSINPDLARVVAKAMARDREDRYESAAAFAADLRRVLRFEPVTAVGRSGWYAARKFVRRNRPAVATAAVIAVLVVVTSIAIVLQSDQIRHANKALLNGESKLLAAKENLEDALANADRSRRLAEREKAFAVEARDEATAARDRMERSIQFTRTMFSTASLENRGYSAPVGDFLVNGLDKWQQIRSEDPLLAADIGIGLGWQLVSVGRQDLAQPLFGQAWTEHSSLNGETSPAALGALSGLARCDPLLLDPVLRTRVERLIQDVRMTPDSPASSGISVLFRIIATSYTHRGDYVRAREWAEEERDWLRRHGFEQDAEEVETGFLSVIFDGYPEPLSAAIVRQFRALEAPISAADFALVRGWAPAIGRRADGVEHLKRFVQLSKSSFGPRTDEVAEALRWLADACVAAGRLESSREFAIEAANIALEVSGERSVAYLDYARVAAEAIIESDPHQALVEFKRIAEILEDVVPERHFLRSFLANDMVRTLSGLGRRNEAIDYLRECLDGCEGNDDSYCHGIRVELGGVLRGHSAEESLLLLESCWNRERFDRGLRLSAGFPNTAISYCLTLRDAGESLRLVEVATEALDIVSPDDPGAILLCSLGLDAAKNAGTLEATSAIGSRLVPEQADLSNGSLRAQWRERAVTLDQAGLHDLAQALFMRIDSGLEEITTGLDPALGVEWRLFGLVASDRSFSFGRSGDPLSATRWMREAALRFSTSHKGVEDQASRSQALLEGRQSVYQLGQLLINNGDFEEAAKLFDIPFGLGANEGDRPSLEESLIRSSAAFASLRTGRADESVARFREVLPEIQAMLPESAAERLNATHNFGVALQSTGQWAEAVAIHREVFVSIGQLPLPDLARGIYLSGYGEALVGSGQPATGRIVLKDALTLLEKSVGIGNDRWCRAVNALLTSLESLGMNEEASRWRLRASDCP